MRSKRPVIAEGSGPIAVINQSLPGDELFTAEGMSSFRSCTAGSPLDIVMIVGLLAADSAMPSIQHGKAPVVAPT